MKMIENIRYRGSKGYKGSKGDVSRPKHYSPYSPYSLIYPILCMLLLGGAVIQAQPREQIEARRIAYITRVLDLSPTEAQQFWPVYNAYKGELETVQQKKNQIQRASKRAVQTKSDKELEELADEYITLSVSQADIQARYHEELKQILPIRKVVLLYKTEQDFNRKILEEIKRRQQERKDRMNNR